MERVIVCKAIFECAADSDRIATREDEKANTQWFRTELR